jgi:glycosyltransferase involved in cell wall biosynthesis
MELVTLSTSRNILKPESRDRARMRVYGGHLSQFHIVVLTRRRHGFCEVIHEENVHLYPTNSRNIFLMLIDAFRIARTILKERSTQDSITVTAQDPLETGLIARVLGRLYKVPYTVQVHGDYYSPYWTEGSLIRYMRRWLIPFVVAEAKKVRVVSSRVAESLVRRGVSRKKIVVLPIRPELDVFLQTTRPQKSELFTVLTVSRFAREKNIPLIVRAFARVQRAHPEMRLRIVGEGGEHKRIMKEIVSEGIESSVSCEPWTDTIAEYMASADVFVLASLHESYGLVLVEALATGTPVITTDVGCAQSVVKDGEHGIVIPVANEQKMYDALVRMYEDEALRVSAGERGRALGRQLAEVTEEAYAKEWVATHSA